MLSEHPKPSGRRDDCSDPKVESVVALKSVR